jgi:hypothetical protein
VTTEPETRLDLDTAKSEYLTEPLFAVALGNDVPGRPYARVTMINWRRFKCGPPWFKVGRDVVYSVKSAKQWMETQEREAAGNMVAPIRKWDWK